MKLKIVHQNQENREGEGQVMKMESEEMDQLEETERRPSQENESIKENSPIREVSPVAASSPLILSGKRRRKPKELIYDFPTIISRRKKKPSVCKSEYGTCDWRGTSTSKGDATVGGASSQVQLKSPTMIRAEEVQDSLGNDQPSFLKVLVRSHVSSCFWMGLPVPFCKLHLPGNDTTVILENESGEVYGIKYIAHKTGLSAGWRKFVAGNKLLEGDVLIFHLIGPCRFKVYIIRENDLTEVDGALSLLILDSQSKQTEAEGTTDALSKKKRQQKSLPLTVVQKKKQKQGLSAAQIGPPEEYSGNDSEEVASEVLECCKFAGSTFHFNDVKSFDEFHIVINGVCIDSELPEDVRQKYYKLCYSKNAFLHDHLLPGLSCKLAAGMIYEAVNTADAIRGCKLTTSRQEFDVWEKSLRSFELLGLKVGFLQARLRLLVCLSFNCEGATDTRRYWAAKAELSHTEDEIQNLDAKLMELKELAAKYRNDLESLKMKAESYELKFQEEASAPW